MVSARPDVPVAASESRVRQHEFEAMRRQLRQTRAEMRRRLADRDRQLADQAQKIAELNRRIVEYDQRFDDIAAEVARVRVADGKPKHISSSDPSLSSGESSLLPKHSSSFAAAETSSDCQQPSASVGAFDHSRSVSTSETGTKKRGVSPPPYRQSKRSKKSDGAAATKNVCRLRSGRYVVYK